MRRQFDFLVYLVNAIIQMSKEDIGIMLRVYHKNNGLRQNNIETAVFGQISHMFYSPKEWSRLEY